ncbi:hypothetical protein E2C01_054732 [Portunus trituberculatus]|uniref:Uncharacterized protein n=1 Tax=Portunus trituberculatus TaxID=210409 RepID=A0A5B7GT07_PORTR|nr:hypothetical protein [Portunus trituberculatus]
MKSVSGLMTACLAGAARGDLRRTLTPTSGACHLTLATPLPPLLCRRRRVYHGYGGCCVLTVATRWTGPG